MPTDPWDIFARTTPSRNEDDPWNAFARTPGETEEERKKREAKRRQLEVIRRGQGLPGGKPALGRVPEPDTSLGAIAKEGVKLFGASVLDNVTSLPEQAEAVLEAPRTLIRKAVRDEPIAIRETAMELLRGPEKSAVGRDDPYRQLIRDAHQERVEQFAEATQSLPAPLSAGLYGAVELGAGLVDPTNIPLGSAVSRPARAAANAAPEALETAGARALRRTLAPAEIVAERASQRAIPGPALDDLARASTPRSVVRAEASPDLGIQRLDEGERLYVFKDETGKDAGSLIARQEPDGFKVRHVFVEEAARGQGIPERLYREAARELGPYRGSTDYLGRRTDAGNRTIERLRQTAPEIFPEGAVDARPAAPAGWGGVEPTISPRINLERGPKSAPLPLPELAGVVPEQVADAWTAVSARYPRIAAGITRIESRPLATLPGGAAGEAPKAAYRIGGTLVVPEGSTLDAPTLFHEITHAAQDLRGQLRPRADLEADEFNRLEAFARARGEAAHALRPATPPGRPDVLPDVPDVLPDAQPLPRAEPDLAAARPGEAGSVSLGPASSLKRWLKENFLSGGRFRAAADDFAPGSDARAFVESVPRSFIEPQAGRYQAALAQQDRLQRELFQAVRAEKKAAGVKPKEIFEQIQRVRSGDEPLSALPARLRPVVQKQFDFLDGLTQRMLDEGAIPDELVQAVEANRNYYHRAYEKYDIPDYVHKVQGTPRWVRAQEFLHAEMPDATPDEIMGLMNRLADSDTGPDVLATFAGAPSRLNNALRSRKNIPEPIRALMGEYKDWRVTFEKSVHNLAWDLTVHQMNRDLREAGLQAGAFRLGADGPSGAIYRDIPVSRKVGDVAARSPLDDVLASPGFVRAMSKELEVARNTWFHKLSSVVNIGKTLGNFPAGYIRNAVVHPLTTAVNGHNWMNVNRWREVAASWQSPSTLNRMLELGLIDGGVNAKEIQDYVNVIEQAQNPAVRASAAVGKKLASWWSAGDDSFRVYNWLAETEALMEARPTMPRPAAEALAADRVKDTFQTYARAPHVAKALRRTLLGSPGTTFAIESTRNLGNIARIAKADIEEGIRTGNMGLVKLGMKRVFGLTAGAVATASLPAVGRYASGFLGEKSGEGEAMDRDQLDAVRRWVAPHYHENAELLPLHFKPGQEILYQDISFLNPYSVLSRPALAMRRGVTEGQSGVPDAVFEFLDQVAGGNIAGTTALEVLANRRLRQRWPMEFGGPIANFDEGKAQAVGKLAYHAYRGAAPGAIAQTENLVRAAGVLPQQEGRDRTLGTEVASTLGARVTKLNIPDAFRKNAAVWDERSGRLKPRLPKGAGPEAAGEIAERYIGNWDNLYQEARAMVEDFKKLGMTNEQIYQQARKAGVKPKPYPGTSGVFWDPIGGALGGAEHFPPPPMWPSSPEEGALAASVFEAYRRRYGTP